MRKYEQSKRRTAFELQFYVIFGLEKEWSEVHGCYFYSDIRTQKLYEVWNLAWQAAIDEVQKALKPVRRTDQLDPVEAGDEQSS